MSVLLYLKHNFPFRSLFKTCFRYFSVLSYRKVTHCIFDLDGTILDSEIMYHLMLKELLRDKFGKKYKKKLISKLHGRSDRDVSLKVVEKFNLPVSAEALENQITELSKTWLREAPLQEGVERLMKHLHKNKVPLALATNSTIEAVKIHEMTHPKIFRLFHHKVCVDDPGVKHGKPQPDILFVAASRFDEKPKPNDCLVFEDSMTGVKAADRAGMQVVMIPILKLKPKDTVRATMVLQSLLDFRPEIFGLPPFDE